MFSCFFCIKTYSAQVALTDRGKEMPIALPQIKYPGYLSGKLWLDVVTALNSKQVTYK